MIKQFFSNTSNIIMTVLILLLIGLGIYFFNQYRIAANEAIESGRLLQNAEAYKDSSAMVADILQKYKVFVHNLQNENSKLNKENRYVKSKFRLIEDSLEVLSGSAQSTNYGDSIIVRFEGAQGKISYKGFTTYLVLQDTGYYSINIIRGAIDIQVDVYLNEQDNFIYTKVYADGQFIDDAYTEVDSALYKKLNSKTTIDFKAPELNFFNSLSIYGEFVQPFGYDPNGDYRALLNIGLQYQFNSGLFLKGGYETLHSQFYLGFGYSLTPARLFGFLF